MEHGLTCRNYKMLQFVAGQGWKSSACCLSARLSAAESIRLEPKRHPHEPIQSRQCIAEQYFILNEISKVCKSRRTRERCIAPPAILFAVTSCDWQGSTIAYDFQQLGYQSARDCSAGFNSIAFPQSITLLCYLSVSNAPRDLSAVLNAAALENVAK